MFLELVVVEIINEGVKEEINVTELPSNKIDMTEGVRDVDGVIKNFISQMPFDDGEIIYKSEVDNQIKIYMFMLFIGILMTLTSLLIWYQVT